jgi:hypothetical protein
MRLTKILLSLALAAGLVASGAALLPSFAGEARSAPAAAERQWLSIGDVYQKLTAAGYRNVEKIEREHGAYEARATDRNGMRVTLRIHPQSGEISDRDERDERHDGGRQRGHDSGAKSSANCNERRCRDDLPTTPPASAAAPVQSAR